MGHSCLQFALSLAVCVVSLSVHGTQGVSPDPAHVSPNPAFVSTGGNVTLTCEHPSHPSAEVRWFRGEVEEDFFSSTLDDPRLVVAGSQLSIGPFYALEHAGQYTCVVGSGDSEPTLISCPAQVRHARIPAGFLVQPEDTTAYEGTDLVLRCFPHPSVPPADVVWMRNGETLDHASSDRLSVSQSGNLYILGVVSGDAGEYRCIASNSVTGAVRRSDKVMLTVEEPSTNTSIPSTFAVEPVNTTIALEGSRAVLECSGHGYPQPIEAWSMSQSRTFPLFEHVEHTGELVVDPVTLEHAGTYTCSIRDQNHTLIAEKHVELIVRVPPRLTATPPPQLTIERGNASAIISCSATATDSLRLFLLHNGTILHSSTGQDTTVQITPPSDLVGSSHTFQCIALNAHGCDSTMTTVVFTNQSTPTTELLEPFTPSTTLAPVGSGASPMVPMINLQASSSILRAPIGERRISSCRVTGPTDVELTLVWFQGASRDLDSDPVDGIVIHTSPQQNGILLSRLDFQVLMKSHNGSYSCRASIKGYDVELTANLTVIVLPIATTPIPTTATTTDLPLTSASSVSVPVTIGRTPPPYPPQNLTLYLNPLASELYVTWEDPPVTRPSVIGFNINWGHPNSVQPVRRDRRLSRFYITIYNYTIPRREYIQYDTLVVYVWAYNSYGEGPIAEAEIVPSDVTPPPIITTPPTTPPPPVITCFISSISPTVFRIDWTELLTDGSSPLSISMSCAEAGTQRNTSLAPPIGSSRYIVEEALPGCTYSVELTSASRTTACMGMTPIGQVFIGTGVHAERFPNGTVQLMWQVPPELRDSDLLMVDIDSGEGWVQIIPNVHIPLHFEPKEAYDVQLRFRHSEWTGYVSVEVPPAVDTEVPPPVDTVSPPVDTVPPPVDVEVPPDDSADAGPSQAEIALIYSAIFGSLAVGCAIVVVIILALKYIQWSRREDDKTTNFRERGREEFQRRSLKRSLEKSVESSKNSTDV